MEDWGDAVEALEEESEEVASVEPEGEPEVLEEETFEDWGDAVEALEEESEEVASAEPEGELLEEERETFEIGASRGTGRGIRGNSDCGAKVSPRFWKKRRLRTGVMQ